MGHVIKGTYLKNLVHGLVLLPRADTGCSIFLSSANNHAHNMRRSHLHIPPQEIIFFPYNIEIKY